MTASVLLPRSMTGSVRSDLEGSQCTSFDATRGLRSGDMASDGHSTPNRTLSLSDKVVYELLQSFSTLSHEEQKEIELSLPSDVRNQVEQHLSHSVHSSSTSFFRDNSTTCFSKDGTSDNIKGSATSALDFNTELQPSSQPVSDFHKPELKTQSLSESDVVFRAKKLKLEQGLEAELTSQETDKCVYEGKLDEMKPYIVGRDHSMETFSELKDQLKHNYTLLGYYTTSKKDCDFNSLAHAVDPDRSEKFDIESKEYAQRILETKSVIGKLQFRINKKVSDWTRHKDAHFEEKAKAKAESKGIKVGANSNTPKVKELHKQTCAAANTLSSDVAERLGSKEPATKMQTRGT